jgi:hypothetical protein
VYRKQSLGDFQNEIINKYRRRFHLDVNPVIIRNFDDVELSPEVCLSVGVPQNSLAFFSSILFSFIHFFPFNIFTSSQYAKIPHIQITGVTPFFDENEMRVRASEYTRRTDVDVFFNDMPTAKNPTTYTNAIKRTLFFTEQPIPFCTRRVSVVKKEVCVCVFVFYFSFLFFLFSPLKIVTFSFMAFCFAHNLKKVVHLSPLQVSCRDLETRLNILVTATDPLDDKHLPRLLQGAVAAAVNGGIMPIYNAFLVEHVNDIDPSDAAMLREKFRRFFEVCGCYRYALRYD